MSTDLREEIRKALERCGLAGKPVLAAVSGGLDSVCLARLLAEEAEGRVEIAHVDHGLRPGSGEDARFVEALAAELGAPFHVVRLAPEMFRPGLSLQAEARRLRRAFFESVLERRGLPAAALAHHADDQAETVLLKCLRGAGPRGAAGMREWDPPYARPLLGVPRSRLAEEAARRGWAHREDPSNRSPRFQRNRVRHELLPAAEAIFGNAARALCRFAAILREDEELLTGLAEETFAAHAVREPEGYRFPAAGMGRLPPALRRRLWLAACEKLGGEPRELGFAHLLAVEELLAEGRAHRIAPAPGEIRFVRSFDDLWAVGARWLAPAERPWPAGGVCAAADLPPGALAAPLAAGRPRGGLAWRGRRPGDRIASAGRRTRSKTSSWKRRFRAGAGTGRWWPRTRKGSPPSSPPAAPGGAGRPRRRKPGCGCRPTAGLAGIGFCRDAASAVSLSRLPYYLHCLRSLAHRFLA